MQSLELITVAQREKVEPPERKGYLLICFAQVCVMKSCLMCPLIVVPYMIM